MRSHMVRALRWTVAALVLVGCVQSASAKDFPDHLMTLVVPYGPGGAGDLTARIFAQKMTELTKQSMIILNKPGAGFVNAASALTQSKPDGYTGFLLGNGTAIATELFKSLPYDIFRDFKHVSTISFFDLALLVDGDSQFKTVADLINYAKAHPGQVNIATVETGSTQNLAADLFKSMAHINVQIVPFSSTSEVLSAVRGKSVQAAFEIIPGAIGQISSKALRPLAVTSLTRFSGLPNVPTLDESGIKGYDATSWNGFSVPANTPQPVVDALAKLIAKAVASPDVREKLRLLGAEARSSTPEQMTQLVKANKLKWREVIKSAGIPRQ